jgi:LysR family hydrogen peroxide-inducible transcriptional activator
MFSIREVEYVLAIAKTGSISKAAAACNVSQPALSKQINKLESVLGFAIFERERNKNIPTNKGRELLENFEQIFSGYKKIKNINKSQEELKIGIIPTIAPYLLPKIVKNLSALKKRFYFFEQKTEVALQALQKGDLDLVILAFYPKIISKNLAQNLLYKKLYREEFFFTTHKSVNISVGEGIDSDKIILLEEGNCINESIEGICNIHQEKNTFAATSIEVVKAMIAINNGYGILPKLALENDQKNFNIKPFKPAKYREIGICYRKNSNYNSKDKTGDKNLIEQIAKLIMP